VVDKEDLTRHDKWLCMMMPRLKLLRELLSEDGAIFISIDYNEEANLRCLLDEIFGEENYRNTFAVSRVKKNIKEKEKVRSVNFGYNTMIFYSNTEKASIIPPTKFQAKEERWHAFDAPGVRNTMEYELFGHKPPKNRHWMFSEEKAKDLIANNLLRKNPKSGKPQYKLEASDETMLDTDWTDLQEAGFTSNFPNGEKNVDLIKRIISMIADKDDIILDSFAGSGTTAHAVLELNKEDGGNRKFILVEQEYYANTITAERVRWVINGVKTAKNENLKNGLGGTFSYFELGPTIEMESILQGKNLPSYEEFARYIFYTATGEEFNEKKINEKTGFIGETKNYELYMFYKPDIEWLKRNALTLDGVRKIPKFKGKQRLVFAPAKYVDDETCRDNRIDFCQLPYEIYRIQK
jgi:adenine-specific DNA-methyltransferase